MKYLLAHSLKYRIKYVKKIREGIDPKKMLHERNEFIEAEIEALIKKYRHSFYDLISN